MAGSTGGELSDIVGAGDIAKRESGRKLWGQPVREGEDKGLPSWTGWQGLPAGVVRECPMKELVPTMSQIHPCSLCVSPRASSVLPRSWTTRSAMAATP